MDVAAVERIAKAVLYEGYMLYPYRPSAIKNRQRFNFGVLHPQCHNLAQAGLEPWTIQTECLAGAGEGGTLQVRLRFLQIVDRTVARVAAPIREFRSETVLQPVDSLEIDGRVFQPWQEAAEQEVALPNFNLADIAANPCSERFQFPATTELEALCDRSGQVCGAVVRRKNELRGSVRVSATQLSDRIFRISLSVDNQSDCAPVAPREEALLASLVSTHFVLGMEG